MKMTYERPMMQAELYAANEYVAACGLQERLKVDLADDNWYRTNDGEEWYQPTDKGIPKFVTTHYFEETGRKDIDGAPGTYLTCICNSYEDDEYHHEGTYYLEHSSYFSGLNKNATYFLYMESNTWDDENGDKLQVGHSDGIWPVMKSGQAQGYTGRDPDWCVAQVRFGTETYKQNS